MKPKNEQYIREKLIQIRKDLGWSYYEVEKQSGVPHQQISDYEEGKKGMTINTLIKLVGVYKYELHKNFIIPIK